jgi:ABC-type multidrug transport system ATPase subunit
LDAYNAHNVIECLQTLARDYRRTVVFTIHQPRSDIFAMFDRLVLLADGWLVYSGGAHNARNHFANAGYECPLGYNVADFIVDITKQQSKEEADQEDEDEDRVPGRLSSESGPLLGPSSSAMDDLYRRSRMSMYDSEDDLSLAGMLTDDEPRAAAYWEDNMGQNPWASQRRPRRASIRSASSLKSIRSATVMVSDQLRDLIKAYRRSNIARQILEDIERQIRQVTRNQSEGE